MNEKQALVSCIMPTYNRREFVPHAIRYFLRQDYENKELIIIDDGSDAVNDLIPDTPTIRYFRLDQKITLGAKLNLACKYAKGEIIANWDDDDWYAARRLQYQVDALQHNETSVCGINNLLYYDLRNKNGYQYIYPPEHRTWLAGSSLCYLKNYGTVTISRI
jgi:glycosyltransferase involved in cell wall biosynthesis